MHRNTAAKLCTARNYNSDTAKFDIPCKNYTNNSDRGYARCDIHQALYFYRDDYHCVKNCTSDNPRHILQAIETEIKLRQLHTQQFFNDVMNEGHAHRGR